MKKKRKLLLGAIFSVAVGLSTMAYAMPQKFSSILPIEKILSSVVTKTTDKQSDNSVQSNLLKRGTAVNPASLAVKPDKEVVSASDSKIPAQVTYLFLFKEVVAFEDKAVEADKNGEDGAIYRTVYKRLASLTDEQSEFLRKTAADCAAEVKITDEAARVIGDRLRAEYQAQLASGNMSSPPPSAELAELQRQRDDIILKHRDLLKGSFGEAFPRFDSYVQLSITSNITTNMEDNAVSPPVNMDRLSIPQIQSEPAIESNKENK